MELKEPSPKLISFTATACSCMVWGCRIQCLYFQFSRNRLPVISAQQLMTSPDPSVFSPQIRFPCLVYWLLHAITSL